MVAETRAKPSYLGLLNAISVGECNAGLYLKAWADVTADPELKAALALVAARETAHGEVFRQRIERLGFTVRDREDPGLVAKLRLYGDPAVSDLEKIRAGRREGGDEGGDPLAGIDERISDESVDELTRDTLRWYVAEERDSGQLLRDAYARVESKANGSSRADMGQSNGHAPMVSSDAQAIMACMTQGFASLQSSILALTEALGKREKEKHR
ncbi:MAG: hypothetical protein HYX51_08090 [Chloroflexi bacterium]|nr:hypothetical protein [Chloroflexota bacterium]